MNALQGVEPETVRSTTADILARDEFQPEGESALGRFLQELFGNLDGEGLASIAEVVLYGLLAALVATLLFLLVRAADEYRRARRPKARVNEPEAARADRLAWILERARSAESEGDLVRAMRFYFFALVVGLGERGDLEYRDAWTGRELLERGEPRREVKGRLAPLIGRLDEVSFGERPVHADDVASFRGLCERWLAPDASPASAVGTRA